MYFFTGHTLDIIMGVHRSMTEPDQTDRTSGLESGIVLDGFFRSGPVLDFLDRNLYYFFKKNLLNFI